MANFYTSTRTVSLVNLIGAPRFGRYLAAANGDVRAALDLYVWNLCLSACFYGPLAILEVTVRNALHRELSALFGPSWHTDASFQAAGRRISKAVYPPSAGARRPTVNSDILSQPAAAHAKLAANLARKAGDPPRAGAKTVPTTDDVVAALDFGYWTSLLNNDVEPVLYAGGLYKAFPNAPHAPGKAPKRSTIAGKLNDVRMFRNRIMHHEPIFNRFNIQNDMRSSVDVCRWAEPNAVDWMEHHADLTEVLRDRFGAQHRF